MAPPLVSVVIIFLNAERFLADAIASVFAQTHDNWELLLVDDGSTDGSSRIATRTAAEHPVRVRYLEHEGHTNRGMSASRNLGVVQAHGEYVAFLDSDDEWVPEKLEQQVARLEAHPHAGMIYGRTLVWHSWTGDPDDAKDYFVDLGVPPESTIEPPELFLLLMKDKYQTPTTCNAMIRRSVFAAVGGFQDSFRGYLEDQVFFLKVALAIPVYVAGPCWARYRQHADSCCAVAERLGKGNDRLPLLRWLVGYLRRQRIEDPRVWRVTRSQFRRYRYPRTYEFVSRVRGLLGGPVPSD